MSKNKDGHQKFFLNPIYHCPLWKIDPVRARIIMHIHYDKCCFSINFFFPFIDWSVYLPRFLRDHSTNYAYRIRLRRFVSFSPRAILVFAVRVCPFSPPHPLEPSGRGENEIRQRSRSVLASHARPSEQPEWPERGGGGGGGDGNGWLPVLQHGLGAHVRRKVNDTRGTRGYGERKKK